MTDDEQSRAAEYVDAAVDAIEEGADAAPPLVSALLLVIRPDDSPVAIALRMALLDYRHECTPPVS